MTESEVLSYESEMDWYRSKPINASINTRTCSDSNVVHPNAPGEFADKTYDDIFSEISYLSDQHEKSTKKVTM